MAEDGSVDYSPELSPSAPAEKDGGRPVPARDHLLQWMEVSVAETEKRIGQGGVRMQDTYVVYLVETKVIDEEMPGFSHPPTSLWRRYSEFELLRNYLEIMYSAIVVPPLPEKRVSHAWQKLTTDRFDEDFINRRRIGLENFLLRTSSHTTLSKDKVFHGFLKQEESWKESVYATDFQNKADSKLKTMSASYRLKKPDRRFEEMRNYSNELQTHITNILKIRAKLADRVYGIHKIHANYGRVFKEWGSIEKYIAEGLNTSGHFMEVYSSSIDATLEDEEQFADQLKEYYAFGDSLRSVCRKQELLQLDLEKSEDSLTYKSQQRELMAQGRSGGLMSKFFGGDTPEQRDVKIKNLDEQIVETEEHVVSAEKELESFVDVSLKDMERFQRQKVKDVKDIFLNYSILQIERCKKSMALWQNTKDSFDKM